MKLSGHTASAEWEKKIDKIASRQFTIDENMPCGAIASLLGELRNAGRHPKSQISPSELPCQLSLTRDMALLGVSYFQRKRLFGMKSLIEMAPWPGKVVTGMTRYLRSPVRVPFGYQ